MVIVYFNEGGKGGVRITFLERKKLVISRNLMNCVNLMPFLTRQPIFTL